MKDAKTALNEIYLRLRLLSRDGMKPEQAAWLDKAQKVAKDALGEDVADTQARHNAKLGKVKADGKKTEGGAK